MKKFLIALVVLTILVGAADAGLVVTCEGTTPDTIVTALLGSGITYSNLDYVGTDCSAGTFSGGTGIIGIDEGIILSSGAIQNVVGPNLNDGITANLGLGGDTDLNALIPGYTTYDAVILEFDFVPTSDVLTFDYVFTSDEYNEFVNTAFNDVFAFFLNGDTVSDNIALIPGTTTPVAINNVNGGGPAYGTNPSNSAYYINNDLQDGGPYLDTEMDGLTTVFTATASVTKGETNHIKLAIADAGDHILDSNVFIYNFQSPQLSLTPLTATNYVGQSHELTATLVDPAGAPIPGVTVTFSVIGANTADGTAMTDEDGIAVWSYSGITDGMDTIVATATVDVDELTSNPAYKTWEIPPYTLEKDFRHTAVDFTPYNCGLDGICRTDDDYQEPADLGMTLPDTDGDGMYEVKYVVNKKGEVTSTNPGQLYAVITITGIGIDTVALDDAFGTQFDVNPGKLGGGVEVLKIGADGLAEVLTDTPQVTFASVDNDAGEVILAIDLDTPLEIDEELMIYLKYQTALKFKMPDTTDFTNTADVTINELTDITAVAVVEFV